MRLRCVVLLLVALSPSLALAQSSTRSVYATVANRGGTPVDGLGVADITVEEDGAPREIVSVAPATEAIDIAVVVHLVEGNISDVREGLRDLFDRIRAPHAIALTGLMRPRVDLDFTRDTDTFGRGVNRLYPAGVNNAYAWSAEVVTARSRELEARSSARRAIIIVTDGAYGGVSSNQTLRGLMRNSGATLYEVVIARSQAPYQYANGAYYVKPAVNVPAALPNATGGRVAYILASSGVPRALRAIAEDLNHQYRVDYARPLAATVPDALNVGTNRRDLQVRATHLAPPQ